MGAACPIAFISWHLFLLQLPLVPLTPALSILLNIYLMLKLSYMTWLRFLVWLIIGKKRGGR